MFRFDLNNQKPLLMQGLFLLLLSCCFAWISLPGLAGGFILDDISNLSPLEAIKDGKSFLLYVLSGISSQLGRPLSLLTFALQAKDWPHNPFPFKLIGLLIHIANAWLAYICCILIGKIKTWPERSCLLFAGSVFGLWLFHPLNISTTFYVVQRMTLLAALFSLIGMALFLRGFNLNLLSKHQQQKSLLIASSGMVIVYVLGILSKENALLTGLGISVMYFTLFRSRHGSLLWDIWILFFGILPFLIVFTYLYVNLDHYIRTEYSPSERFLTELVILMDYLDKILIPTPYKLNIFNDGYPVYKNIIGSNIVFKTLLIWLVIFMLAFCLRKRFSFFTFAILWFLSGHLLESSIFGLELYFEHRNYLPCLGIMMGIIGTAIEESNRATNYSPVLQKTINYAIKSIIITMGLGFLMVYGAEVSTWRQPGSLALSAITERPNSMRSFQVASEYFANKGDFVTTAKLLDKIENRWPSTGNYAQYLMLKCYDEQTNIPSKIALLFRFRNGKFDQGTVEAIKTIYTLKKKNYCQFLYWQDYLSYLNALVENPAFSNQKEDLLILQAYSYSSLKQPEEATKALDKLPNDQATLDYLLFKAQFFAVANHIDLSLAIIKEIKSRFGSGIKYKLTKEELVSSFEEKLLQNLAKKRAQ